MNKSIALHPDEQLKRELLGRQWGITSEGKIKVESKEEYRKRTKAKSPDKSDSLALSFARYRPELVRSTEKETNDIADKLQEMQRQELTRHDPIPHAPTGSGFLQRF